MTAVNVDTLSNANW